MINYKKLIFTALGASVVSFSIYGQSVKAEVSKVKKEDTDVLITLGIGGVKADSTLNTASTMGVGIGAHAKHYLTKDLHVRLSGGLDVQTGSSSSARDNNIYAPSNGNYLKEAAVSYSALQMIELEAGVINQSFLNAPMVVSKKGFIAAKEKFNYKILDTKISLVATQAVPNNRNLSQKINVNDEGDPRFFAESLIINQELYVGDLELAATHFAYDNISNSVAYESILLGNTGTPISKGNGELANTYSGWNFNLEYVVALTNNFSIGVNGNYLQNTAATENNTGRRVGTALSYKSGDHSYSLELENFSIDADASIAYYNSSRYGLANKEGNRVRFEYKNHASDLKLGIEGISNTVINENIYQSDETVLLFSLRKSYDLF